MAQREGFRFYHSRLLFLVVAILLTGCCARTPAVHYYQLAAADTDHALPAAKNIGDAVIGIGPVRLPEFLDRPQIVIRQGAHALRLSDRHRWAEPLADNISRVLRENLAVLLNTERLLLYPWGRSVAVDYQLLVEVIRFEEDAAGAAHLEAVWSVQDRRGKMLLPQRRSRYQVVASSPDPEGRVGALSETLHLLCRQIARELVQ